MRTTLPLERSSLLEEENECTLGPDFTFIVFKLWKCPQAIQTESCQVCSVLIYVELEGIGVIDISLGNCGKWKKQRASSTLGEAER